MAPDAAYCPQRGDVVWLTLLPQTGHEQSGRHPVLVLSPRRYNARVGLCLVCPVTTAVKGYPFEVALPDDGPVTGVVLADQLKSVDWRARKAQWGMPATPDVVEDVLARLRALLDADEWDKAEEMA